MQDLRRAIPILLAALVAAVGLSLFALRQARPAQIRYFPETDATVREPFLSAFEAAGGVDVLGLPLTDAYQDENGSLIQPFERMVFAQTVRGVAPSPVGTALSLGTAGETAGVDPAFAEAYATLGGQDFFGLALSPARQEANFLVQDFATARLLRSPDGSVGLAPLGRAYLSAFPPPQTFGQAQIRLAGTPAPQVEASISVAQPTLTQGQQQTLYLYVQDASGQTLANAQSLAVLRYNNGTAEVELPPTDANGAAAAAFIGPPAAPGSTVLVEVTVLHAGVVVQVETTYVQWW